MSKQQNQKSKILYIAKLLYEKSDINHPISTDRIISYLAENGIKAERKSIYTDINALTEFGISIENSKASPRGYYIDSRLFELAELKILIDCVSSSQFLTERKTTKLIKKIEQLCSNNDADKMNSSILVANRIKHMNESIYYSVDGIHNAIAQNKRITFKYFNFNMRKEKEYHSEGKRYCISPIALLWNNEHYYLIGYDDSHKQIRHYRVDRMERIDISNELRSEEYKDKGFNIADYVQAQFNMFSGEEEFVQIRFNSSVAGVVFDKFGKNVTTAIIDENSFDVMVNVPVSPQFYAWVFGLGENAKIVSPQKVKDGFKQYVSSVLDLYK